MGLQGSLGRLSTAVTPSWGTLTYSKFIYEAGFQSLFRLNLPWLRRNSHFRHVNFFTSWRASKKLGASLAINNYSKRDRRIFRGLARTSTSEDTTSNLDLPNPRISNSELELARAAAAVPVPVTNIVPELQLNITIALDEG